MTGRTVTVTGSPRAVAVAVAVVGVWMEDVELKGRRTVGSSTRDIGVWLVGGHRTFLQSSEL